MQALRKIAALAACVCVLGAGSALAAEGVRAVNIASPLDAVQAPSIYVTRGEIVAIEDGRYVVKGEGNRKLVAAEVSSATYVVEGTTGKLRFPTALKVGEKVTAYYSSRMTRSLPGQSQAYTMIIGEPGEKTASYFEVAQATLAADGSYMTVLNSNNDLIATVDAKACSDFAKIKKGDKLLLWSSFATMSLPAQTNAERVVILP